MVHVVGSLLLLLRHCLLLLLRLPLLQLPFVVAELSDAETVVHICAALLQLGHGGGLNVDGEARLSCFWRAVLLCFDHGLEDLLVAEHVVVTVLDFPLFLK